MDVNYKHFPRTCFDKIVFSKDQIFVEDSNYPMENAIRLFKNFYISELTVNWDYYSIKSIKTLFLDAQNGITVDTLAITDRNIYFCQSTKEEILKIFAQIRPVRVCIKLTHKANRQFCNDPELFRNNFMKYLYVVEQENTYIHSELSIKQIINLAMDASIPAGVREYFFYDPNYILVRANAKVFIEEIIKVSARCAKNAKKIPAWRLINERSWCNGKCMTSSEWVGSSIPATFKLNLLKSTKYD